MPVFGPNLRRALVAVGRQACCAHCASASARIAHYERIAAPDAIVRLRRFIFDLAVRRKLVPQNTEDEPASELIKEIAKEIPPKIGDGKDGSWPSTCRQAGFGHILVDSPPTRTPDGVLKPKTIRETATNGGC
jgi:hypothetical protein